MAFGWPEDVAPLPSAWHEWRTRVWQAVRCFFHCHTMGVPQRRDPRDLDRSAGPCRYCGGEHLWRAGRWVATRKEER